MVFPTGLPTESEGDRLSLGKGGKDTLGVTGAKALEEEQIRVKVRIDNQGRIVIPAFVRTEFGIKTNERFLLIANRAEITLRRIEVTKEVTAK